MEHLAHLEFLARAKVEVLEDLQDLVDLQELKEQFGANPLISPSAANLFRKFPVSWMAGK